jgi:hypothetical protein
VGIIGIEEGGELLTYIYSNALIVNMNLLAVKRRKGEYIVYGKKPGNPDDPYGGYFRLTFAGKKRIVEYEYYEQTE